MSRRFDARTTSFDQEGRLKQVEYAMEAINKAGSAIGVLTHAGIILATEKQSASALLEQSKQSEKIYALDKHLYTVVSGVTADANYLIDYARLAGQQYRFAFRDIQPIEQLIQNICDLKQRYTQVGGMRPFGAAFLYAGHDHESGYQLYSSDPSGNYVGWKAKAIGNNNEAANSYLKEKYKDDITLDDGLDLAVQTLAKALTATLTTEKIEIMTIVRRPDGTVKGRTLGEDELKKLIEKNQPAK